MNVELDAFTLAAFGPICVQMVAVQSQLLASSSFRLDLVRINPQINHGPQEHVPAQAAENIKIKCVQSFAFPAGAASVFIWLAA